MPAIMVRWTMLAVTLSLCSLLGCENRVAQCNRLVDVINAAQPKVAEAARQVPGDEPTPESLINFAAAIDELVSKTRAVKLDDLKLAELRDQYVTLNTNLAKSARSTAEVLTDEEKARKAAEELNAYGPKERDLVKKINDYCAGDGE